jgi:hypothetical protein
MAKQLTKTEPETVTNNKPKEEIETVVAIAEQAISFRGDEKPTLAAILRFTSGAARMLRIKERDQVANAAALVLGKRYNLLGSAG